MADQNEVLSRVSEMCALLIQGVTRRDAVKFARKKYNVSSKQAYNYVTMAIGQRSRDLSDYRKTAIADQISKLQHLYRKNYKIEDYKECRAIMDQMSKLLGLNEPSKHDVTSNGESLIFNPIDLKPEL